MKGRKKQGQASSEGRPDFLEALARTGRPQTEIASPDLFPMDYMMRRLDREALARGERVLLDEGPAARCERAKLDERERARAGIENGGDRIIVDRIGRDPIFIEDPRLTIVATTQPEALRDLAAVKRSRGVGLLARFLFVLPRDTVGHRDSEPPSVPGTVREAYASAITTMLDALQRRENGSRHLLVFSEAARRLMSELCAEIEPRLGEDGDLRPIVDWAGKLAGAVARIAGLLHAADHCADPKPWHREVSAETVARAITIGRYLLAHALAAFDAMGADPEIERARTVWRRLEREGWASFSKRDVHRALRGRTDFAAAEDLDRPLAVLVARGYIRPLPRTPGPGRPSERFEVRT